MDNPRIQKLVVLPRKLLQLLELWLHLEERPEKSNDSMVGTILKLL